MFFFCFSKLICGLWLKVVAVKGKNPTGGQFIASSFYEGILPPPVPEPKNVQTETLSIFIAVGPFTTSESDSYEPLTDFLSQVSKEKPNLVVLMGPFVDAKNDLIEKCEIHETFQELFARKINEIGECAKRLSTKFVIIPSQRDVHHNCVYPQPPFCSKDIMNTLNSVINKKKNQSAKLAQKERDDIDKNISSLQFFSDPCTLDVNGFTLGMTSTDVLFQMGGEEIAHPPGSADKMGRLVKNILTQQ
ncbi:DNA polymerase alpha subunit B, partial [Paramuricea clavata]